MRGETILCLSTRAWDSMWREAQQHMSRIARQNRVLFFEPGRNPDRAVGPELVRNLRNLVSLTYREVQPYLYVIPTPSSLPYARRHLPAAALGVTTPLIAAVNGRLLVEQVRRAMRFFGVRAPILWLYDPRQVGLIGQLGEKLACYYVYDEYADFPENGRIAAQLRAYDARMTGRADVVLACSPAIWERRRRLTDRAYLVPNAVDFELFNGAVRRDAPPSELAALPRPIIGSAGMLDDRVDVAALLGIARAYPHGSLVLVGPDRLPDGETLRRLRAQPNVHFLGQKEPRALPDYVRAFDVALVPYLIAAHTLALYPLKLFEYLAVGRPIVAAALPEIRRFSPAVRLAESSADFVHAVGEALGDDGAAAVEARLSIARANTWDQRVDEIYRVLGQHLPAESAA